MSCPQGPTSEVGQRHAPKGRAGSTVPHRTEAVGTSSRRSLPSCDRIRPVADEPRSAPHCGADAPVGLPTGPRQRRLPTESCSSFGMRVRATATHPFRVLQPVVETSCPCDVWTGACKCAHQDVTATPRGGDRLREQTGAKSVARAPHGAQAAEVDCVGVHAFTTGNVRARDPGVTRVKPPLLTERVEAFCVSTLFGRSRLFVVAFCDYGCKSTGPVHRAKKMAHMRGTSVSRKTRRSGVNRVCGIWAPSGVPRSTRPLS